MKKFLAFVLFTSVFATSFATLASAKTYFADDAVVEDDVKGFVITAWDKEPFGESGDSDATEADLVIITNVGEDADFPLPETISDQTMIDYANDAWHWAEANRGYGDFAVAKLENEDFLRFAFDGTTEDPDSADGSYFDYSSHRYPGATEGQVKRLYGVSKDRLTGYIMYYCEDAGVHKALRVDWIPDSEGSKTGSWKISNFYKDNVQDYTEMEICARFNYYDSVGGVKVTTEETNLNVRAWPGGDLIGSLEKGATITIYRCEQNAEDGRPFTLISKWTEPDDEGYSTLEYFGWVATEFITESPDWAWVLGD